MLITDMKKLIQKHTREQQYRDIDIAEKVGMSRQQYSYMLCNSHWVNDSLVATAEALGYDIDIRFVKRGIWDEYKTDMQAKEKEMSMSEAAQTKLEQPLFKDINTKEEIDQFIAEIMKNAKL